MPGDEVRAFEATDGWRDAVALRRWDDAGKVDGLDVPRLDELASVLHAVARPPRSA
jgi:predicted HD phosphohydrolase